MVEKPVYDRLVFYAGDVIFKEGEDGNWAYLIQSGKIEIFCESARGGFDQLGILGPGRLFGEMALIDNVPRMATARAVTQSVLVLINGELMLDRVGKSDPLVRELLRNFASNLREAQKRFREMSGQPLPEQETPAKRRD